MGDLLKLKAEVLETAKLAYSESLFAGTSGNLSARDPSTGLVVITPSSLPYPTMEIDDLVVTDVEGTVVEGTRKPSSELKMHLEIYRNRADVLSVFHTHSPYATAFAVIGQRVPLVLIEMVPFIGGDIPVAGFALPGSRELGAKALEVLAGRNACLMANHGVLAIGKSVAEAHLRAVYVEDASRIYHHALCAGKPRLVPDDAVREMRKMFISPLIRG